MPGEPNASPFPYHPDYASLWASVELRAYPTSFLATGSAPRPGQVPAQGDTGSVGELDVEDDHGRAQGGNPDQGIGHRARLADNLEPYRPAHARGRSPRAPPSPRSTAAEPRDEERLCRAPGRVTRPVRGPASKHLICRSCGLVLERQSPALDTWVKRTAMAAGFSVQEHRTEVRGLCRVCLAHGSTRPNGARCARTSAAAETFRDSAPGPPNAD